MAIGDPYVTVPEFRLYIGLKADEGLEFDSSFADAINSASREIENYTGRQFNKADTATRRLFEPVTPNSLTVDDFWSLEGLSVDNVYPGHLAWLPTEDVVYPLSGVVDGTPGWAYNEIKGSFAYYPRRYGFDHPKIGVTAKWGWAEVPAPIKQATLILAAQNDRLKDAPLGIAGMQGKFGGMTHVRDIPAIKSKINRYVSEPIMVG